MRRYIDINIEFDFWGFGIYFQNSTEEFSRSIYLHLLFAQINIYLERT